MDHFAQVNATESNFFDVNMQNFAVAPGQILRLTYIGKVKKNERAMGYLAQARNVSNGSVIGFDFWHAFVPSVKWATYIFIAMFGIFALSIASSIATNNGLTSAHITPGILALVALVFLIAQLVKRSSAIKKISLEAGAYS